MQRKYKSAEGFERSAGVWLAAITFKLWRLRERKIKYVHFYRGVNSVWRIWAKSSKTWLAETVIHVKNKQKAHP